MKPSACSDSISQRIAEWQTRLLQLNRRNNLLYFKPGRSAVGITGMTLDALGKRLRRSRTGLRFPYVMRRKRKRGFSTTNDPNVDEEPRVIQGDLTTDCGPADLQRRLRNLQRRDREWEEEQGLNVLFLALGFLNWIDEDGDRARSPLVLIPCDLVRKSPGEPFRLQREDDDSLINPTLCYYLSRLGLDLPDFADEHDEPEPPIAAYVAKVNVLISGRQGWSIDSEVFLGTFSYTKLAMYEDLTRMLEEGVRSELTRMLAGDEATQTDYVAATPSATPRDREFVGGQLDDVLEIRDQYTVLPTDFSQLRAIDSARKGSHLVIHGPPGTGKSQTITNLIATLLGEGKRVLFVSEKTAALDVVKRRLEECDLGVFCLDLHSDRGRKSQVYKQLKNSLSDTRETLAPDVSMDDLVLLRKHLNGIVRLLHRRREPLGKSVYQVQGRFAQLRDLPRFDELEVPHVSRLTNEWLSEAADTARRIELRPREFACHTSSRWRPLRAPQQTLSLPDLIRDDLNTVLSAIDRLKGSVTTHSRWLGLPSVESTDQARRIVRTLRLLADTPGIPTTWLRPKIVAQLRVLAREQSKQQRERRMLTEKLSDASVDEPLRLNYRTMKKAAVLMPDELEAIDAVIGDSWRTRIGQDPVALSDAADSLSAVVDDLLTAIGDIGEALAKPPLQTLGNVNDTCNLASRILELDPVPDLWFTHPSPNQLKRSLEETHSLLNNLEQAESRLHAGFSDQLVDLVDEEMLIRYRTDHQSAWRRLGKPYRQDQRIIRGQLIDPHKLSLSESLEAVRQAHEIKQQRETWLEREPDTRDMLSERFQGRGTDWEGVLADLETVHNLQQAWHYGSADEAPLQELTTAEADGKRRSALKSAQRHIRKSLDRYHSAAARIGNELLTDPDLHIAGTREAVRRSLKPLRRISEATIPLFRCLAKPPADLDALTEIISVGVGLMAIADEDKRLAPALATDFGHFFEGASTSWEGILEALDWTEKFLNAANGSTSGELECHARNPQPRYKYTNRANSVDSTIEKYRQELGVLDQRFDLTSMNWDSWDQPSFTNLRQWAVDLRNHSNDAPAWIEYQDAVNSFDEFLGAGSATKVRCLTERAEDVPGIVKRRIYDAWLEAVYSAEPELGRFNRVDHEDIRERFSNLDELFPIAARRRVRERVFLKYPEQNVTPLQAGQVGTLNGELSKKTRHLPVRRLIRRIPDLLQTLKPCFLMSPLAVSQYLPAGPLESNRIEFDAVIFDEASQVLPEDALPAIERGRQVIVVGDRLQLPPTTFFQRSLADDVDHDSDEDETSDSFKGRESILDVMVGQVGNGIEERYLSVHYRSRSESLIRFSNHAFYEDRLLTFPDPDPSIVAVKDVFLPGATYDAGGSRTNREEAERVTDIVFDLMKKRPREESIGVVALSRSQANLIETLIEERRLLNRHLDDRFSGDLVERFFVKNLENVQGDERDHMILSVGYGPTAAGAVPNRFGPINQEGGERRLNVAVTRARQSMTVVHSLRAEDIRSTSAGARQLRRYLEYVRNPEKALEAAVSGVGEPESPFEEAVLATLRERGHQVEAQVGVSGYRIDLAIKSEDGERFDLGIECDGATYHRSPAARDRDWLRQQVLEGLGWHIHRVWSTAWIRDCETEIRAIEDALEQARLKEPFELARPVGEGPSETQPPTGPSDIDNALPAPQPSRPAQLFDQYRHYEGMRRWGKVLDASLAHLAKLVTEIVAVEQPVHVDIVVNQVVSLYGTKAGKNIRQHIVGAVKQAKLQGTVTPEVGDGLFLHLAGDPGPPRPRRRGGRKIGLIAGTELDAGLLMIARKTFGASKDDLVRETARKFGFQRVGQKIKARLDLRIEELIKYGGLSPRGDMLIASDDDVTA
ncbi:MAG: DUF4011 domain-containing protein [bacterium]|nr:DUF4011 domain-containing protein [bacterium]